MKSFSFKALALTFVVVTGQANAYYGEETVNKAYKKTYKKVNSVCALVSKPYVNLAESICEKLETAGYIKTKNFTDTVLRFPLDHHIITRTVLALGVAAAVYKAYKHFTKPAADATEGENVEAEANTEVVA